MGVLWDTICISYGTTVPPWHRVKLPVVCCHFPYRKSELMVWLIQISRKNCFDSLSFFTLIVNTIWANTEIKREERLGFKMLSTDSKVIIIQKSFYECLAFSSPKKSDTELRVLESLLEIKETWMQMRPNKYYNTLYLHHSANCGISSNSRIICKWEV